MRPISIFILFVCWISCTKDNHNSDKPYYKFTDDSKEWFTDLKKNDTLTFISNSGRTRTYNVISIDETKEEFSDVSSTLGARTIYFTYDQRRILFERIDSFSTITDIVLYAFVPDTTDPRKPVLSNQGIVKSYFEFDDYIGNSAGERINPLNNFSQPASFTKFTIGSKTFNDILELSCNCTAPYYDTGWNRWNTIDKIRYSKSVGFINFEMVSGETWNRQF